jgi:hypothetical protein
VPGVFSNAEPCRFVRGRNRLKISGTVICLEYIDLPFPEQFVRPSLPTMVPLSCHCGRFFPCVQFMVQVWLDHSACKNDSVCTTIGNNTEKKKLLMLSGVNKCHEFMNHSLHTRTYALGKFSTKLQFSFLKPKRSHTNVQT